MRPERSTHRYDAVVIGGGIVGCATALFLAHEGLEVALMERHEIAACQSGLNAGWIRALGRTRAELPLVNAAIGLWRRWMSELEIPVVFGGGVSVAVDEPAMGRLLRWRDIAEALLPQTEVLDPAAIAARWPFLGHDWRGGLHHGGDGHCDPVLATRAIAERARALGASIWERRRVDSIAVSRGAVRGVVVEGQTVQAPLVICAAGAWSSRVLRRVGVSLPIQVVRSTVLRTHPIPPLMEVCAMTPAGAFRQAQDGSLVIAGGVRADVDVAAESLRYLRWFSKTGVAMRRQVALHPGFLVRELAGLRAGRGWRVAGPWPDVATPNCPRAQAALAGIGALIGRPLTIAERGVWAGYVDVTPDSTPVIGPVNSVRGLHVASGFSGHGFGVGPAAGLLAAQLALGREPIVDPTPFALARMTRPGALAPPEEMLI